MTMVVPTELINFRSVIQTIGDPLVIVSGAGSVQFGNTAFCNMLGMSYDNIIAKSLFSLRDGLFDQVVIRENLYFLFSNNEKSISFDLPQGSVILQGKKTRIRAEVLEKLEKGMVDLILIRFEDITDKTLAEIAIKQKTLEILERTTQVTKIWDQILIVPMIGTMDSNRAYKLIEQLLVDIRRENAKFIIIDGNGVSEINAQVATHIINAISAINLLGAQVILTGLKPDLAMMMVDNGVDLKKITSKISLPEGIKHALSALGFSILPSSAETRDNHQYSHGSEYGYRSPLRIISPFYENYK